MDGSCAPKSTCGEFWHYYPTGIHSSLLFIFLSFPDKRMAAPPNLSLKHIFLVGSTLFRACVPSGGSYIHTPSVIAECGRRGNRTELLGVTADKCAWEMLSVQRDLWMVFLPGSHLPGHPHSLRYQIHPAETRGRSDVSPCRYVQCFCPLPGTKPCQVLIGRGSWLQPAFHELCPDTPYIFQPGRCLIFTLLPLFSLRHFLIPENVSPVHPEFLVPSVIPTHIAQLRTARKWLLISIHSNVT